MRFEHEVGQYYNEIQLYDNNTKLGWIAYSIENGVGFIAEIVVIEYARLKGYGKLLVDQVEQKLRLKGISYVTTGRVTPWSVGFWLKLGYKPIPGTYRYEKNIMSRDILWDYLTT